MVYTADGARGWHITYRMTVGTQTDRFLDVAVTSGGKVVLAGDAGTAVTGDPLWTVCTLDGSFREATMATTVTDDRMNAVTADAWGGTVLAGWFQSTSIVSSTCCWVERVPREAGGLAWLYRSTPQGAGTADHAAAVAAKGAVVAVAGAVWKGPSLGYDQAIFVWTY